MRTQKSTLKTVSGQCKTAMKKLLTYSIVLLLYACGGTTHNNKSSELFPIKEFGKWGYINSVGETTIKCQFDAAEYFSERLAAIRIDSLWGFIDTTGTIIIEPKFYKVTQFSDGLCYVTIPKDTTFQNAFIRTDGSIAFIDTFQYTGYFNNGRATALVNEEVCIIDKSGKIVINTHYPYGSGSAFHEGIVHVWGGGDRDTTKYYDTSGNIIAVLKGMGYGEFSEGLALVRINDSPCYIDRTGKVKVRPKNQDLTYFNFSDGLAQAVIAGSDHKTGFIDTSGNIVIPVSYNYISDFKEGLAVYWDKDGCGLIDKREKVVMKPQFKQLGYEGFSKGLWRAIQDHQWGYINHKGEFVWKAETGLEYAKLDLSKWKLDTLKITSPLQADRDAADDNFPRKQTFASLHQLSLKVDTTDVTVYADRYFAYKLYLINASKDTVHIPVQDGRVKIIQQAKNKKGDWQDIENFINSFCGNSYYSIPFAPNEFQIFATPIFKGEFKTQLRFKLELGKKIIYSTSYIGQINYGQLLTPKDKDKTGIAVWTN